MDARFTMNVYPVWWIVTCIATSALLLSLALVIKVAKAKARIEKPTPIQQIKGLFDEAEFRMGREPRRFHGPDW